MLRKVPLRRSCLHRLMNGGVAEWAMVVPCEVNQREERFDLRGPADEALKGSVMRDSSLLLFTLFLVYAYFINGNFNHERSMMSSLIALLPFL